MSFLQNLRDRLITEPVAKRILESVKPIEKGQTPSIFAVPIGFNNSMSTNNKRQTTAMVDFPTLRSLSINHETTRAAINTRKRQITQLGFDVVDMDEDTDAESTAEERQKVRVMLENLGGPGIRFRELLDKLIEDTLVLDALCFYKQRTRGKKLLRIIPVDAATIKLRVGPGGERPLPPEPAFEQWIRGKKITELTTDELTYEMMNPRTDSPYGLSPLESLIIVIDSAMRSAIYNLNYLSDNNIPQGFLSMPENWTPQQIKEYKEFFDAMVSGSKEQAKVFPIPSGTTYQATSKPSDFAFSEFFDYLDRKVCMLFDVQPQELGLTLKQYKENAEGQEKISIRRGMKPLANFLQEVFDDLLHDEFNLPQFKTKFTGLDGRFTLEEAKAYVPLGVISVDEIRNDLGLKKLGVEPFIIAGNSITPVDQIEDVANQRMEQTQNQMEIAQTMAEQKPKPSAKPAAKKLEKFERNLALEKAERSKTFRAFRTNIHDALTKQLQPFTNEANIARVTQTKKAEDEDLLSGLDDELPTIQIEGLDTFLKWAAEQGGQNAYDHLNLSGTFALPNASFQRMLGNRATYLIDSLDETTKDWLVSQIESGKAEGLTNAEVAKRIHDEMDTINLTRANTIVNTEVANAMQQAELDTYHQQGISQKVWMLSEDIGDLCGENAAQGPIGVSDVFVSGDDAPPGHPNCRCFIQAVVE